MAVELFIERALGDGAAVDEGARERNPELHGEEERGLDLLGPHETGSDQASTQLERHGRTLYQMTATTAFPTGGWGTGRQPRSGGRGRGYRERSSQRRRGRRGGAP